MTLRVAIVGDSAMWGQGLRLEHTFARLGATEIAEQMNESLEVIEGLGIEPGRGHPRSGAKIKARLQGPIKIGGVVDATFERPDDEVVLPSGRVVEGRPGDRTKFCLTFPDGAVITDDAEMEGILSGGDESAAARLYGEHPAPFPTVTAQVRDLIGEQEGSTVQLLLLNGGINDIDFEDVLDPEGPGLGEIGQMIESIFHDDLRELLRLARRVCPNALIMVVGYFSVFSDDSDRGQLESLFKYIADKPAWQVAYNDFVQEIPALRDVLNLVGLGKDIEGLIETAVRRSVQAAALAHFWTQRTVAELFDGRGKPGIVFATPAFRPENALFANGTPFFNEGYKQPDESNHVVADEMLATRRANIPRLGLLSSFKKARLLVSAVVEFDETRPLLETLMDERDLPTPIRRAARRVLDGEDGDARDDLRDALDAEIGRLEVATIASFVHPTAAGAKRTAERIVDAFKRHRGFSLRGALEGMSSSTGGNLRVASAIRRHGVRPSEGLRQLVQIATVDSVAVAMTSVTTLAPLPIPARLVLGPRVTFRFRLASSSDDDVLWAFDTIDDVRLADIQGLAIEEDVSQIEATPIREFEEITLFLNGREFFRAAREDATVEPGGIRFNIAV